MTRNVSWIINFFFIGCLLLPLLSLLTKAHYHDPQSHYQSWYRPRLLPIPPRRASDLMADIINELGIRILQQHVESGNVAFSPTGIGFILAALYEGSASRSRQQIIDSLGMPRDKNVVRIGMKDIHKRLRTYLNPDGFLGGLNLNRENTSLRAEYESILQFYGFDLTTDFSNFAPNNTSNFRLKGSSTSTMASITTTEIQMTTMSLSSDTMKNIPSTTVIGTSDTTTADETTMQPRADTTVDSTVTTIPAVMPTLTSQSSTASPSNEPVATTLSATTLTTTTSTTRLPATIIEANVTPMPTGTTATVTMTPTTTPAEGITTAASPPLSTDVPTVVRRRRDNRRRRNNEAYFSTIPDDGLWMQNLDIWADQVAVSNNIQGSVDLQFLVNGCELANVPAASYTAVLPFAYFPSLKAAALEFPLDNPRYNVMLLLPTERVDTGRLARELSGHSLRLLRRRLQATLVHATIPSFMLRGFVTLTPYLQRLGIKDVFEPRLADLTPMTPDLGVYARDVQQSIAVNIRNYMKEEGTTLDVNGTTATRTNLRDLLQEEPLLIIRTRTNDYRLQRPASGLLDRVGLVSFAVDHPFLYFIIDDETSASLIAGRIDDPLNSRIL